MAIVAIFGRYLQGSKQLDTTERDQTYQVDPKLLIIIVNLVYRLKRNCYICDLLLLVYTTVIYNLFADDMRQFAVLEGAMILILGFIQYSLISAKSKFVTHTAIDIKFTTDYVIITTAAFDGPLWFKKGSAEVRFKRAETVVKQVNNPFPLIFKNDSHTLRLRYKSMAIYVMAGYFPWRVEEELNTVE